MKAATIIALAANALMAGLFFSFSTFTMHGLRHIPARDGLVAMQGINRSAPASMSFITVFLGGGVFVVVLGIVAATRLGQPEAPFLIAGALLNVVGLVVTTTFHVPRNDGLGRVDPDAIDAIAAWTRYAEVWTRANHVRTVAYLASTITFAVALTRH